MSDKYIYKLSFYESKRHIISHTDWYYAKLEDCLWVYDRKNYLNKNDKVCECVYNITDFFDIQVIKVSETDDKYETAIYNSKLNN
jgi:hypothetical protein